MSRAEKRNQALKNAKNAKQKKILIGLAPLLLGMLAWQGPGMMKGLTGGEKVPPPVVQPEGGVVVPPPGEDPTTAPPPSTAAPTGTPAVPAPTAVSASLPNTDDLSAPGPGQLVAFDRFVGKDPFKQLIEDIDETAAPPADDGGDDVAPPPAVDDGTGGNDGTGGDDDPAAYTAATLSVNGNREIVPLKGTFPSNDPVFKLRRITRTGIEIILVTGGFTEGQEAISVRVGRSVTLVSQPDGLRFVIKLISVE
jgi:hypothetical protein